MNILTNEFLEGIGIHLDGPTYQAFSEHFDDMLFDRIIEDVIDSLDEDQLEYLSKMRDEDSDKVLGWLQTNVPEFNDIIKDEVDILLGDIAENADHI
ncbi:MAG: DUF5663 domain-containing protein [Candidatus Saccharimonadales bacterium]